MCQSVRAPGFVLLASAVLAGCGGGGQLPLPELPVAADTAGLVARGEYLVRTVAVCGHCHAEDPQADPDGPLVGGLAFRNWRLGTIRASNLTPDTATGLGLWSVAEVVRAIRTGQARDGDLLAPVMPYRWLHGMSDRDALAVALYLRSLPPVRNEVRSDPSLVLKTAELLFLSPIDDARESVPPEAPTAEYGGYLANHVALCGDCHTPRTGIRSTPDLDRRFAGQSEPPGSFPANPDNLTPDPETGIGRWSEEEFLRTLRTGVNPRGDTLHPFMPWREYRRMRDDDLRAIYRYLRTLPAISHDVPERDEQADVPPRQ